MPSFDKQGEENPSQTEEINHASRNTEKNQSNDQSQSAASPTRHQEKNDSTPKTVVIACGGLSLADTDWSKLPFPIAAINKAIWVAPRFEYWFIADGRPERVYKDRWIPVAKNPMIAKCVPKHRVKPGYKKLTQIGCNIHALAVSQSRRQDAEMLKRKRSLLDGKAPLFFMENKTTLFATQWLAIGFKRIIYVGCELTFTGKIASCTGSAMASNEPRQMRKNLDMVRRGMIELAGAASKKGIEMLSFSPGLINDFMPRFSPCPKSIT